MTDAEIKVGVGTTFTYLGIDCIVTSNSRLGIEEELYEFIFQYVNVVGEIVSGRMNESLMNSLIRQGKIVIKNKSPRRVVFEETEEDSEVIHQYFEPGFSTCLKKKWIMK